jgi:hypothetical protein
MPQVTCRCGEELRVPAGSPEYINCTHCGARIRLRRPNPRGDNAFRDGFIRFLCPCGRRLKVSMEKRPKAGKCPDCERIVPIPTSALGILNLASGKSEAQRRTEDLDESELVELRTWRARHLAGRGHAEINSPTPVPVMSEVDDTCGSNQPLSPPTQASFVKFETGLRVCPRCRKPLHLGADNCRECGMPVPRQ